MNTKKMMHLTELEAHRNLWEQVLLGDMGTDNIPGLSHAGKWEVFFKDEEAKKKFKPIPCHQYGKKSVEKILNENPPEDYPRVAFEYYIEAYETDEDDLYGEQRFYETFALVFMLRKVPKDLRIHFNPIKVKSKDLEFDDEYTGFRPALEF